MNQRNGEKIIEVVHQLLLQSDGVISAARQGILNTNALARKLSSEVNRRVGRKVSVVTIALDIRYLLPIIISSYKPLMNFFLLSVETQHQLEVMEISREYEAEAMTILAEITTLNKQSIFSTEECRVSYFGEKDILTICSDVVTADLLTQRLNKPPITRRSELTLISTQWRPPTTDDDIDRYRILLASLRSYEVSIIYSRFVQGKAAWLVPSRQSKRALMALQPFFKPDKQTAKKPDWGGEGDLFVL
jgi:hypothetical protein